jgi:hypothetical protein
MWTELLITDVTAMREGRVCIAGIDKHLQNIRPVLPKHIYREYLRTEQNEVIRPRSVVRLLLKPERDPVPPHTEDHFWPDHKAAQFLRDVSLQNWYSILQSISQETVEEVFEVPLQRKRNIPAGSGTHSLGTLQSPTIEEITYRGRPDREQQLRLVFRDSIGVRFDLPINDLNLISYVNCLHKTMSLEFILKILTHQFTQADHIWLRLGLTRPFEGWCWVQVNGIFTIPDYLNDYCYAHFEAI